ncbi:hypothetical protein PKHYL_27530 [Psychrobacter sp. KH172YL61]|nr:hypothetical protein PKHYL_27530 [Psychrobacter sp. KH172YL61]
MLAGRYIEHNARLKAATMANDLVVVEPVLVQKVAEDKSAAERILQLLKESDSQQGDAIENEAKRHQMRRQK